MKKLLGVLGIIACIVLLVALARGYNLVFWIGIILLLALSFLIKKLKN